MTETLAHGYSFENTRILSESYTMNTNMTWFKWFSKMSVSFERKKSQHSKGLSRLDHTGWINIYHF